LGHCGFERKDAAAGYRTDFADANMNSMRKFGIYGLVLLLASSVALMGFLQNPQTDRKQLREMLVGMGYEVTDIVKDAGKEKYSVKFTREALDIPVGYEISPSNSYVWLTVNLGNAPTESASKNFALLKQNAKIQPSFFYVTESGRLMMALAVENRGITPQVLRTRSETIADNVGKTKDVWQSQ
jgi:hypothetical protein